MLLRQGWKPKRTIILCFWDGEEPGLLGSTEWAETHADELRKNAVVYINSDGNGRGYLGSGGFAHPREVFQRRGARHRGSGERSCRCGSGCRRARESGAGRESPQRTPGAADAPDLRIGALGSGSDYTAFLDHVGIASLNLGFGGEDEGGIYHSDLRRLLLVHALLRHRLSYTAARWRRRRARQ